MKKLMILGASYSQLPLYETARSMGIHTIAVSTPGDWPGFAAADACSYTDISNPSAVLKAAEEQHIDGITTCCLDTGVRAIGYVCEKMGLKGLSAKAGEVSSDKFLMKEAFQKGGVRCARHICVRSLEELKAALDKLSFPVIVKAVDLMGSRGMFRCNTKQEALAHYQDTMSATRKDYCLVEEFIEGQILGCEAMISHGRLVYCLPNNIDAYPSHVPTPVGHSVPYKKQGLLGAEIERQVLLAIAAVGLDNCPVNCDLIEKDNQVYVIEITGRAGATCLPEMVSIYYGINYYEAIIRLALGMEVESMFGAHAPRRPNLSKILTSKRAGIVRRIENENPAAAGILMGQPVNIENGNPASAGILTGKPGNASVCAGQQSGLPEPADSGIAASPGTRLLDLSFNISPGDEVRRYENGRDRLGQAIIDGDTLEACEQRLDEVLSKINIEFIP